LVFSRLSPFVTLIDQHNGDVIDDRIFATAGFADQPGIPEGVEKARIVMDAYGATKYFK
jgi:hypothetical protein